MRKEFNVKLDRYRTNHPLYPKLYGKGYMGFFLINYKFIPSPGKPKLAIMSSGAKSDKNPKNEGFYWEHVSVSLPNRCPTWEEMCFIKDLFWDEDETVIQFHPPKKNYVNEHKFCLHLWKPTHFEQRLPPVFTVG